MGRKKKVTYTEHHEYTHHCWGIDKLVMTLFKLIILLIVVTAVVNIVTHEIVKDETVYKNCLDACSKKHFMGMEVGTDDVWGDNTYVNEYDRTNCIDGCGDLYKYIKKAKG